MESCHGPSTASLTVPWRASTTRSNPSAIARSGSAAPKTSSRPSITAARGCRCPSNANYTFGPRAQHFTVVGVDASEIAIEKARDKASKENASCTFAVLNILKSHADGAPFGFAFDRGCFHTVDSPQDRQSFVEQINRHR